MTNQEEKLSTREKLLHAGVKLFSQYGYNATTSRMISAESGLNVAAVSFHFGSKENYYAEVLRYAASEIEKIYEYLYIRIDKALESGISRNQILALIEEYLSYLCDNSINSPHPEFARLAYWESLHNTINMTPVNDALNRMPTQMMVKLLKAYWKEKSYDECLVLARAVIGGIIFFKEHIFVVQNTSEQFSSEYDNTHLKKILVDFYMRCITENV